MIHHPKGDPEDIFISCYRWNPFTDKVEYWAVGLERWRQSYQYDTVHNAKEFGCKIVSYRSTWCEPTWDTED